MNIYLLAVSHYCCFRSPTHSLIIPTTILLCCSNPPFNSYCNSKFGWRSCFSHLCTRHQEMWFWDISNAPIPANRTIWTVSRIWDLERRDSCAGASQENASYSAPAKCTAASSTRRRQSSNTAIFLSTSFGPSTYVWKALKFTRNFVCKCVKTIDQFSNCTRSAVASTSYRNTLAPRYSSALTRALSFPVSRDCVLKQT